MTNLANTIPPEQIKKEGEPVFPELRRKLGLYHMSELTDLVDAREAYGIAKYGQTLLTDDGRDTPTEIVNEMLDADAYLTKWTMQRPGDMAIESMLVRAIDLTADIVSHIESVR